MSSEVDAETSLSQALLVQDYLWDEEGQFIGSQAFVAWAQTGVLRS
jgi:hypothetical protein